jgi:hypothetical protein
MTCAPPVVTGLALRLLEFGDSVLGDFICLFVLPEYVALGSACFLAISFDFGLIFC